MNCCYSMLDHFKNEFSLDKVYLSFQGCHVMTPLKWKPLWRQKLCTAVLHLTILEIYTVFNFLLTSTIRREGFHRIYWLEMGYARFPLLSRSTPSLNSNDAWKLEVPFDVRKSKFRHMHSLLYCQWLYRGQSLMISPQAVRVNRTCQI